MIDIKDINPLDEAMQSIAEDLLIKTYVTEEEVSTMTRERAVRLATERDIIHLLGFPVERKVQQR